MRSATISLVLAATLASGCGWRSLYHWRDEPYLRPVYAGGEEAAHARMQSRGVADRDIGCRVLSVIGREALRTGDQETARRTARDLMAHYQTEPSLIVRASIMSLCLRNVGTGDEDVAKFLKERIARIDMVASASYTLAVLRPAGAFEAIKGAYDTARDTGNFEHRYELLLALWLLGDARAVPLFESSIAEVEKEWPARIHNMKKKTYARTLASRLETLRVACR